MRRTKILATLGPASTNAEILEGMIAAGLNAVRLNFSHGTREGHAAVYKMVRDVAQRVGRPVAVLQDLQGPKIRIGLVRDNFMEVPTGSTLTITTRPIEGHDGIVSTVYRELPRDVRPGERILLDEGRIEIRVRDVRDDEIVCDVIDGGTLSSNKGLNVPGAALTAAAMTDKDRADVKFGLALGVDWVALSFVRRARDVEDLRELMRLEGRRVPIIAKIEKPQAIENLDEIIEVADGVMVARGDLAVEVSLEMIPAHQKLIIARANRAGKLAITATQMLESMTHNPMPTRAEVTDVANAVLDGTDALMLSGETAVGNYPVETVRRMAAIAETTEESLYPFGRSVRPGVVPAPNDFPAALARLAALCAHDVDPKAIVVFTRSGRTAELCSDERPRPPIFALTTSNEARSKLALYWGVSPRIVGEMGSTAELVAAAEEVLLKEGIAQAGDTVVFLLGSNRSPAAANLIEIVRLGAAAAEGDRN